MTDAHLGRIVHYWPRAKAAEITLETGPLRIGDRIRIVGHDHDFIQLVRSLQIEHHDVKSAKPGDHVAVAVPWPVHAGDEVLIDR